jgi:hypothetical protein
LVGSALTTIDFGADGTASFATTRQVALTPLEVLDRRSNFGAFTATLSMSDLSDGSGNTITADKFSLTGLSLSRDMGSGLNTGLSVIGINFASDSDVVTVLENTAADGGGQYYIDGQAQIALDSYPVAGTYTGTLTLTIQ